MLSLTRKAGYGLIAMAHLAHHPGQRVSAREIAQNPLARSSRLRAGERLKEENEPGAHHERGETRETAV